VAERTASETPLAHRAVRGGLWVALSTYWTLAFGFGANIFLTRMLPPDAFGTFALATFFAQLFRIQTKLGLSYAFGQHRGTDGESVGTYAALEAAAAGCGVVLMGLAAPVLRRLGYEEPVVQVALVLSLAAFLEGVSSIAGTLLEKELRFHLTSLYQSLVFPLSYLPAFWLAWHGGGVWSLAAQTTAYSFLLLGLLAIAWRAMPHLWREPWRFRRDLALSFLRFGSATGLWWMAGMLFSQLDNFLIGTFVGVTALGYYDRAYRIAQWPALLFNAVLSRTAFYTYARLQEDRERLRKAAAMVAWGIGMIAVPVALAIFLSAREIVMLLYGERWLPSALFLQILIAFFVIRPQLENAGVLWNAMGKPGRAATLLWLQVGILGIAGVPLTGRWGALGTCGAVGLALAVGMGLTYIYLRREISARIGASLISPVLAGGLALLGFIGLLRFLPWETMGAFARLLVKAAYALLAFYAVGFILQAREAGEPARALWRLIQEGRKRTAP